MKKYLLTDGGRMLTITENDIEIKKYHIKKLVLNNALVLEHINIRGMETTHHELPELKMRQEFIPQENAYKKVKLTSREKSSK